MIRRASSPVSPRTSNEFKMFLHAASNNNLRKPGFLNTFIKSRGYSPSTVNNNKPLFSTYIKRGLNSEIAKRKPSSSCPPPQPKMKIVIVKNGSRKGTNLHKLLKRGKSAKTRKSPPRPRSRSKSPPRSKSPRRRSKSPPQTKKTRRPSSAVKEPRMTKAMLEQKARANAAAAAIKAYRNTLSAAQ